MRIFDEIKAGLTEAIEFENGCVDVQTTKLTSKISDEDKQSC